MLLIALVLPSWALARPTVAVAPLAGDRGNKVGNALATALAEDATVVRPKEVRKAMARLKLSGEVEGKPLKKLRGQLEVDVVVQGTLDKDGKKQRLELSVTVKNKKPIRVVLRFKTTDELDDEVRGKLRKRIAAADDTEERPSFRKDQDEDKDKNKPRRTAKARASDRDDDEDDDARTAVRKKAKKRKVRRDDDDDDDDEPAPRHPVTQAAVHLHAGAAFSRRTLTYDSTAAMAPPSVGTAAGSGRIDGEVYPFAFDTLKGPIAGLGFAGEYAKTVGLSIDVPRTPADAPIDQASYAIGLRYRIPVSTSAIAFGLSYARRHYIADRSALPSPTALDMPDVDYAAIAPGVSSRIAATPTIGVFASVEALLMLSTGQIQQSTSYGPADVIAFEVEGGVEIALAPRYGLRLVAELNQVGFTFKASPGTMAATRNVQAVTDRTLGLAATLMVRY